MNRITLTYLLENVVQHKNEYSAPCDEVDYGADGPACPRILLFMLYSFVIVTFGHGTAGPTFPGQLRSCLRISFNLLFCLCNVDVFRDC